MADLYGFAEEEGLLADGVELALVDVADVGDEGGFEVAHGSDVAEMVLLFVGSGDEVGAAFEGLVEDDESAGLFWMRCGLEADGAEVAGGGFEGGERVLRGSWDGVRLERSMPGRRELRAWLR